MTVSRGKLYTNMIQQRLPKNYQTFPDIRGEAGETDDHRQVRHTHFIISTLNSCFNRKNNAGLHQN